MHRNGLGTMHFHNANLQKLSERKKKRLKTRFRNTHANGIKRLDCFYLKFRSSSENKRAAVDWTVFFLTGTKCFIPWGACCIANFSVPCRRRQVLHDCGGNVVNDGSRVPCCVVCLTSHCSLHKVYSKCTFCTKHFPFTYIILCFAYFLNQ